MSAAPMTEGVSARFLELHQGDAPLLIPNPWDAGSARVLAWLGFDALATTSSGFAATLGRADGSVSRDEALRHAASVVDAVEIPVSADLENGFADDPGAVADLVLAATDVGLAGCSIEDFTGVTVAPIYEPGLAVERIAAAAAAAHSGPRHIVLTARCENYLHGRVDLADTISRLQAFQEAGADVLYAPGLTSAADIRAVVESVDRPINVVLMPDGPSVAELKEIGVRRISVGGSFAWAAMAGLVEAARELRESGTTEFFAAVASGRAAVGAAFAD
ncbi:MAG TPA: isocitrate lyase/phosphoenolpyruvate mutase family protein [Mycobacteriales bacterium]|nr:isocitrate lyase/phosphoenolpyruvate mutase family protein [Mycobacteriales bacterium]